MRFAALSFFLVISSQATVAAACDKEGAAVARSQFLNMGRVEPGGFRWSANTQSMPDQMRAHLMETYAKADACLNGAPRAIHFYQGNKSLGQVGVDGRFAPSDPHYDVPAKPGVHVWMDAAGK